MISLQILVSMNSGQDITGDLIVHTLKDILITNIKIFNNCWEWQGTKTTDGYGIFYHDKIIYYTHRLSYELFVDKIPDGLQILHSCDNPCCINPEHLRVGTNYDNVQDRQAKNRQAKGISHGRHKLTENEVLEIKRLYSTGKYTQQELSDNFNMSRSHICNIINNKFWKHIIT